MAFIAERYRTDDRPLDIKVLGQALKELDRKPVRCRNGWAFKCLCGNHDHDDRKQSAEAWIDAEGRLAVMCHKDRSKSAAARKNLLAMMGIGDRVVRDYEPTFKPSELPDDKKRAERVKKGWDLAYPIPEQFNSPPNLWLLEKCHFYGMVPPAIRWEPKLDRDGMVGAMMGIMATSQEWTDAYPNLPEPKAIHRVGINADGKKAHGLSVGKDKWVDKKSLGPMSGSAVILGDPTDRTIVRVCEGLADALSIYSRWEQPTWTLCGTAGFKNDGIARDLAEFDRVIIHADAGQAGEDAALALRDKIRKAGGKAAAFAPAGGEDPADARGEIAGPISRHVEEADTEGGKVSWHIIGRDNTRAILTLNKVIKVADENEDPENRVFSRTPEDLPRARNSDFFPMPEKPSSTICAKPAIVKSRLPKGERHFDLGDCGVCGNCVSWWGIQQRHRFHLARTSESMMILTAGFETLQAAQKWCDGQRKRSKAPGPRLINVDGDISLIMIYTRPLTARELKNTERSLKKAGVEASIEDRAVSDAEFDRLMPEQKTLESADGTRANTVAWAGVPTLGEPKESDYTYGNCERIEPEHIQMDPSTLPDLPVEYETRRRLLDRSTRAILNSMDRMNRPGFGLTRKIFLDLCEDVRAREITSPADMRTALDAMYIEYGASEGLIYDTAKWWVGKTPFRLAYGPVIEKVRLMPDYIREALERS